ncbi:hypothetical protein [Xanthobacter agilis]|uniref:Uncharacterized protein n=1 Tax=Xanthobacter agilis TaxID=47492 RepID=A0ABU0LJY4_XANAG|nr:hypothetical protein [Xanthobacter agilis]MDQ0507420.1 hypothetical protein [Xanthobacter agilis]
MPKATDVSNTVSRRAEDAATITLMLLKATILGPRHGGALAEAEPKRPVLAGGAAHKVKEGM